MTKPILDMSQPKEPTDSQIASLLLSADEMHEAYELLPQQGKEIQSNPLVFVK